MIRYLGELGYIADIENAVLPGITIRAVAWEITPRGLDALAEFSEAKAKAAEQKAEKEDTESKRIEERAQDRADAERRYRNQNKITVVLAICNLLLGLLIEHFSGIVGIVVDVFQKIFLKA